MWNCDIPGILALLQSGTKFLVFGQKFRRVAFQRNLQFVEFLGFQEEFSESSFVTE